jgi:hypothetical protein
LWRVQAAEWKAAKSAQALTRYLSRVSRRVWLFRVALAASLALATACCVVLGGAYLSGPSVGPLGASLTWGAALVVMALSIHYSLGDTSILRGSRRALLLRSHDPSLSARARSVVELSLAPNGSAELIEALSRRVWQELEPLPAAQVAPRPVRFWSTVGLAWLAALLASAVLLTNGTTLSGLYALTHPGQADPSGTPLGLWVERLDATVTLPAHLGGTSRPLLNPRVIEAPAGSRIELVLKPRFPVERAAFALPDRTLSFTGADDDTLRLSLTVVSGGDVVLRGRVRGDWIADSTARKLVVQGDGAPAVTLSMPTSDVEAAPEEPVPFVFRAEDDHGLGALELVVQLAAGRERRVRLQGFEEDGVLDHSASTQVTPADFGAQPGRSLTVWIEARDRDLFSGPNVGRSAVRTITVGKASDAHGAPVALIVRARDAAVDALGTRLASEVSERSREAASRANDLKASVRALLQELATLTAAYEKSSADSQTASVLHDMERRIDKLGRTERKAAAAEDLRDLRRIDADTIAELEDDTLWLSDLVGRARLSGAAGVLDQLEATRARMHELLNQLKASADPEQRKQLLEEIARARAALSELAQRLSEARGDVPSDFVNYDALAEQTQDDPLSALENALERGDVEAAERALAQLDQQLDGLKSGLSQGEQAFAAARTAPRNQALDAARAEIDSLSRAQKGLANDTSRLAHGQSQRALDDSNFRQHAGELAEKATQLEERVRRMEAQKAQPLVAENQASAAQRLRDTADALRQGDAHEASSMAERAADQLSMLASELDMDARMYPGPDGSRRRSAQESIELAREARKLAQSVREHAPRAASAEPTAEEASALREQSSAQRTLAREAGRVANESEGTPPSVRDGLSRARQSMESAAEAMQSGDPSEAQAHQRDALDRLGELEDELSREQMALGDRPGSGERDGRAGGDDKVDIPTSSENARRADLRRRVLDARRARAPESFSDAVERYYQEILR